MEYYIKRTIERVREHWRSSEDIKHEINVDESTYLHLAARNSIANIGASRDHSITSNRSLDDGAAAGSVGQ
ncbi:hypothetical protein VFPPC_16217 [Pochonia chlamydosporia 170]|uniref:Uncharacterized protein n=1 Tax=Pochonia chlamydosporia 170 TaxID=1380566 RepID=A0A179FHJ1_METCM|nr:hypothetical protein VFPPC_16217 [Pochonia chlamydosporia 170]OAQ64473.1 hypothetical protein VFPPC_16217 [Pochonia chlamydosporia 170]